MSNAHQVASKVAFLHIPKCGGVSVESQLKKHFAPPQLAPFYFPHEYKDVNDRAKLRPYMLIIGHFDHDLLQLLEPGFVKAILFREPLARAISLYNHAASRPRHALHESIRRGEMTFASFCNGKRSGARNTLAKYLLGRGTFEQITGGRPLNAAVRNVLELAMTHLDHFDCMGMLYDMERFHRILSDKTGLRLDPFKKINSSPPKVTIANITREEMSAFEAANVIDIEVYEAVRTRYEQSMVSMPKHI